MPREIITHGTYKQTEPWAEVGWARNAYVNMGVRSETQDGFYMDLDREGINKLIRVLRKARDQAFGSDA